MRVDQLKITEVLVLDKASVRTTADGYIVASPRVGRIGIQLYRGSELGKPDMDVVRVYRPETEVMDKAAMASLAHRPVTNDHPPVPVTADNFKKYGVGHTGGNIARDGEYIRVDMMLMDASVIKDYNDGKKELSLGYTSQLEWRSGETPQGEKYDAVQTMIRINHLAVVDAARGGPKLAIGDNVSVNQTAVDSAKKLIADGKVERKAALDASSGKVTTLVVRAAHDDVPSKADYPFVKDGKVYRSALESIKAAAGTSQEAHIVALADELLSMIDTTKEKRTMSGEEKNTTIVVDGVSLFMSDIAASVVLRRVKGLEQEASDLHSKLASAAAKAKKDQEELESEKEKSKKKMEEDAATIATLQKQVEDSKLTPAKLDDLVKDRAEVIGRGRVVLGDKLITDGKTDADMRRQVVDARLGDTAKGWTDDQVRASFIALTADIKPDQITAADSMRTAFSGRPAPSASAVDRDKPYSAYDQRLSDAWKNPGGQKAN